MVCSCCCASRPVLVAKNAGVAGGASRWATRLAISLRSSSVVLRAFRWWFAANASGGCCWLFSAVVMSHLSIEHIGSLSQFRPEEEVEDSTVFWGFGDAGAPSLFCSELAFCCCFCCCGSVEVFWGDCCWGDIGCDGTAVGDEPCKCSSLRGRPESSESSESSPSLLCMLRCEEFRGV